MAHYGWTADQMLKMTPTQVLNAWAVWKVAETKALSDHAFSARLAQANDKTWKKSIEDLET
jgi:hypothetical protein